MTTKQQVIDVHRAHRDWGAMQIAEHLGCCGGYVRATARRNRIRLPRSPLPPRTSNSIDALGRACRQAGLTVAEIKDIAEAFRN